MTSYKVKFTMSGIQSKIVGYAKKQENTIHKGEKKQLISRTLKHLYYMCSRKTVCKRKTDTWELE